MKDFVEQLWTMVMDEQIAPQHHTLFAMKQALQRKYPDDTSAIAQAYEIVRKQLVGA